MTKKCNEITALGAGVANLGGNGTLGISFLYILVSGRMGRDCMIQ